MATLEEKQEFSKIILGLISEHDLTPIEAILFFCEQNELEPDVASELLDHNLKSKVTIEASDKNLLKEKVRRIHFN